MRSSDTSALPDCSENLSLLELCEHLANSSDINASEILIRIKNVLGVQGVFDENNEFIERVAQKPNFDVNEASDTGLRAIDILCRGLDSDESCFAALYLMQAGASIDNQPCPSEAAPLHASAFHGNFKILCTLLDLGVSAQSLSSGSKQQLMGSTAAHAIATGFRKVRAQDYAQCFGAIIGAGCDIDAIDRRRQAAIDIAMRSYASTTDSTLVDAMLEYGVNARRSSGFDAASVAQALSDRAGNPKLLAQLSSSAVHSIVRSVNAMRVAEDAARSNMPSPT